MKVQVGCETDGTITVSQTTSGTLLQLGFKSYFDAPNGCYAVREDDLLELCEAVLPWLERRRRERAARAVR